MIRSRMAAAAVLLISLLVFVTACKAGQADDPADYSGSQPLGKPMFNDINGGSTTGQFNPQVLSTK